MNETQLAVQVGQYLNAAEVMRVCKIKSRKFFKSLVSSYDVKSISFGEGTIRDHRRYCVQDVIEVLNGKKKLKH